MVDLDSELIFNSKISPIYGSSLFFFLTPSEHRNMARRVRRDCHPFESLCDGQHGYACNFFEDIPPRTSIEEAKQMLIGHTDRCIQRLQETNQREIATFYIGRTYVPDNRGVVLPGNPQGWNMKGIEQHWGKRKRNYDGLVVLTVVRQDNPLEDWEGTLQDYATVIVVGLMGDYMENPQGARLENQHLFVGRQAVMEHPKFALFMAFKRQHPMGMDIADMMIAMFG